MRAHERSHPLSPSTVERAASRSGRDGVPAAGGVPAVGPVAVPDDHLDLDGHVPAPSWWADEVAPVDDPTPVVHDPEVLAARSRAYAQAIGTRLRRIRNQQQLSLADVEARSDGRWKAVVVGAYERGDRAVNIDRLARLATFYGVPLVDLLPDPTGGVPADDPDRIVLDLTALDGEQPALAAVRRFAEHVQQRRGDRNGRLLTLRGGDLETVAIAAGTFADALHDLLEEHGALLDLDPTRLRPLSTFGR